MNKKEKFLCALPYNFNRQKHLKVTSTQSIPGKDSRELYNCFAKSGFHRESQDNYISTSLKETRKSAYHCILLLLLFSFLTLAKY